MQPRLNKPIAAGLALAALLAAPALAEVRAGVDAWSRGDYNAAVHEWEAPAAAGDPDAMFNLAQAYRLGRGVPANPAVAESLYARAAADGHLRAADTYGLMLFERGQREEALPYIRDAARRGDPRAQYLLGIAHFNGDDVELDWLRAYALMLLANAADLPPAAQALAEMDQAIPLAQRQQAAGLAERMHAEAEAARKADWAAFSLDAPASAQVSGASAGPAPQVAQTVPVSPSPSIDAARAAVAEARRTDGTENPAGAGASYTHAPAPAEKPLAAEPPSHLAAAPAPASPEPSPPAASGGPWRVQLGAFAVSSNAEALWRRLEHREELAGAQRLMVPAGRVTKLQAGGFPSRAAAQAACAALKRAGHDCLATDH
jgi:cell division septation protein DedD